MSEFAEAPVRAALGKVFAADSTLKLCHPFGALSGPEALYDTAYAPLLAAMPDLERRDMIVMAGTTPEGQDWIGTMGNYMARIWPHGSVSPPRGIWRTCATTSSFA